MEVETRMELSVKARLMITFISRESSMRCFFEK